MAEDQRSPIDMTDEVDDTRKRSRREARLSDLPDLRLGTRTGRTLSISMKTTEGTLKLHRELMSKLGNSQVEIYEMAIQTLKEKLDAADAKVRK